MRQRWIPVAGCPGYEVSSLGNFRSVGGKPIQCFPSTLGYLRVRLGGVRYTAHRLVCLTFHGPAPPGMPDVLHGPKGRTVNYASNVRWGNDEMNYKDRAANGERLSLKPFHYGKGERHPKAKLTRKQVGEMRRLKGKMSQYAIGRMFGICQPHVCSILKGSKWK